jgi:hypothetical protein
MMVFVGVTNGIVFGWLIGFIIDKIKDQPTVKPVTKHTNENIETTNKSYESENIYNDAKYRFKYISNDLLLKKYTNETESISNIEKLALEEELVNRGLMKFSPMHEKMNEIKSNDNSATESIAIQNANILLLAFDHYSKKEYGPALLFLEVILSSDPDNIDASLLYCEIGLIHYGHSYIEKRLGLINEQLKTRPEKFNKHQVRKFFEIKKQL